MCSMHLGRLPISEVAEVCEEALVVCEPRVCGGISNRACGRMCQYIAFSLQLSGFQGDKRAVAGHPRGLRGPHHQSFRRSRGIRRCNCPWKAP